MSRAFSLASALLLFVFHFVLYIKSPTRPTADSLWYVPTAFSLVTEGSHDVKSFKHHFKHVNHHALFIARETEGRRIIERRRYNLFPHGNAYLSVPLVSLLLVAPDLVHVMVPHYRARSQLESVNDYVREVVWSEREALEKYIASFYTALSVVFIFGAVFLTGLSLSQALAVAVLYGVGTSAWSLGSRALWQHGTTMCLLSGVLLCFSMFRARNAPWFLFLAGLLCGSAYHVRPTNLISVVCFSCYSLWIFRGRGLWFIVGSCLMLGALVIVSVSLYGTFIPPYYTSSRLHFEGLHVHLLRLAVNWISPSRGLLIFSPFLFLLPFSLYHGLKKEKLRPFLLTLCGIITLHSIAISLFPVWTAGETYGPRYLSDMVPFCIFLIACSVPPVASISRALNRMLIVFFLLTGGFSTWVHMRGCYSSAVHRWNTHEKGHIADRIWDWSRPQFLRGL